MHFTVRHVIALPCPGPSFPALPSPYLQCRFPLDSVPLGITLHCTALHCTSLVPHLLGVALHGPSLPYSTFCISRAHTSPLHVANAIAARHYKPTCGNMPSPSHPPLRPNPETVPSVYTLACERGLYCRHGVEHAVHLWYVKRGLQTVMMSGRRREVCNLDAKRFVSDDQCFADASP